MIPFHCPLCGTNYQVAAELNGQPIRCRECDSLVRLPPQGQTGKLRARRVTDDTPWFYGFLTACCSIAVTVIFIFGGLIIAAGFYAVGFTQWAFWGFLATVALVVAALAGVAVLMLLIDIGLTMRRLLKKTGKHE